MTDKGRKSLSIREDLHKQIHDAVEWLDTRGLCGPEEASVTGFLEAAARDRLDQLWKLHNEGKPFPTAQSKLRRGRRPLLRRLFE
jgi:hypothetical protein